MRASKTLPAAVAACLALAACASPGAYGSPVDAPGARTRTQPVTVRVENLNWQDVVVYAVRAGSGARTRLGTVTSMSTQLLRLPPHLAAPGGHVRFMVDPIGTTRTHLTEGIAVWPGARISFSVMNHLPQSSLSILHR